MILEFFRKQWGWVVAAVILLFILKACDSPAKQETPVAENKTNKPLIRHYVDAYDLLSNPSPSNGKEITVNGLFYDSKKDANGSVYVLLTGFDGQTAVNKYVECYISSYSDYRPESLTKGEEIQIQGMCGEVYNGNVIMVGCKINPL